MDDRGWEEEVGSHCFLATGLTFGVMQMSWNLIEVMFAQH